ncbi:MAG: hypothetical protein L3K09_04945, partial [Thermoplasmata archaeon]|nr:hypothetical protein [Thermoplasmata archaeon]
MSSFRIWGAVVSLLCVALLAALIPIPLGTPTPAKSARAFSPKAPASPGGVGLSVFPGSWQLVGGGSAQFSVAPTGAPEGCALGGATYQWWLPGISANDGWLNDSGGSSVRLTAFESAQGSAELDVAAQVSVNCANGSWVVPAFGQASIGIQPALFVSDLSAYPSPAAPGSRVVLQWTLSGGLGPFAVHVDFGDGKSAQLLLAGDGTPFVDHRYVAGLFAPEIAVTDATGRAVAQSVMAPLSVSGLLSAIIESSRPLADPGTTLRVGANVTGGFPPYSEVWTDGLGELGTGTNWTVQAPASGNLSLELVVIDSWGNSVTVNRSIPVASPPSIAVSSPEALTDTGVPFPVGFSLSGGVAPFHVNWSLRPASGGGSATFDRPGRFVEEVSSSVAGELWVEVNVSDAMGLWSSAVDPVAELFDRPTLTLSTPPGPIEAGSAATLGALELGGAPPIHWGLFASLKVTNATASNGSLPGPAEIAWTVSFVSAGSALIEAVAVDAAGVSANASEMVSVTPALNLTIASVAPGAAVGDRVAIRGLVTGGEPPYDYLFVGSDGESLSANQSAPGSLYWNATPGAAGALTLTIRVTDALGVSRSVSEGVAISPANTVPPITSPPPATGSPPAVSPSAGSDLWPLALLGIVALGG